MTNDYGNSKWYHVVCGCGQPDHSLTVEVEAEDTGVSVNTYVTLKSDYWTERFKPNYSMDNPWLEEFDWAWKRLANGLWRRLKLTWVLWTRGYVQTESTILMSRQQALNYAETLKDAVRAVEEFRKEQLEK